MSFDSLGLGPEILKAVAEAGYTTPTPIQTQAIPAILAGRDIMGGAQTGTGKTAGFTLPILQLFAHYANASPSPARHPVRALILTPTRELAMQVEESVRARRKQAAGNDELPAYKVSDDQKRGLLAHLVRTNELKEVLVFVRTKHGAGRLARQLEREGINATAIHGDKTQGARVEALEGFKAGEVRVLVATDVAARGLDIEELPTVINYELPYVAEDYIHRI